MKKLSTFFVVLSLCSTVFAGAGEEAAHVSFPPDCEMILSIYNSSTSSTVRRIQKAASHGYLFGLGRAKNFSEAELTLQSYAKACKKDSNTDFLFHTRPVPDALLKLGVK